MTAIQVPAIRRHMGRTKLWHESFNLTLAAGMKERIDRVLLVGETRLDFFRKAISDLVEHRERRTERDAKPKD